MKTVINNKKEITIEELISELQGGGDNKKVVFYMSHPSEGNESYPVFLKRQKNDSYGFISPIFSCNCTYEAPTIRDSITAAISGGKKLLVLERNEVSQLFKKIN